MTDDMRPASQREVDLLNATVFGVQGQGGLLREMQALRQEIKRQSRAIWYGGISMAAALVGLAASILSTHH